jgi:hypothetical protein
MASSPVPKPTNLTHTIRSIAQTQTVLIVPTCARHRCNGKEFKSKRTLTLQAESERTTLCLRMARAAFMLSPLFCLTYVQASVATTLGKL